MKITIVTGFFLPVPPVLGGATEKIWHRLAQEFAAAGHEVTFISRAWPGFAARETVAGVAHIRLPGANHTRFLAINLWRDFFWGVRAARSLPSADVVVCNSPILPSWLGRVRPSAGKVVAVVARMPKGQARAYHRVDLVLALSETVADRIRAENPALASRIAQFPFPIDWQLHAAAVAKALPPEPVTIGFVGRVHPEKGIRLLLEAAVLLVAQPTLPLWRLQIVGPVAVPAGGGGTDFRDALAAEFGPSLGTRVAFVGPQFDPEKLAQHYGEMDVFCYPSLADKGETFGVAVAEAMAAGCAPVVSNLACFRDLVRDGDTGLIFDHAAPDAAARLAAALGRFVVDTAFRREIAGRAQAFARRFDFAESARTVLADFARIVPHRAK